MYAKLIALILVLDLIQCPIHAANKNIESLTDELSSIQIAQPQRVLALGAVPSERDHAAFSCFGSDVQMLFLNGNRYRANATAEVQQLEEATDWADQLLVANFNSPEARAALKRNLENFFDYIVPAQNVTYFMNLNKSFIEDFVAMLKTGGKLVLKDSMTFHLISGNNIIMLPEYNADNVYESVYVNPNKYGNGGLTLADIVNGDFYTAKRDILQSKIRFQGLLEYNGILEVIQPVLDANYREYVHAWMHYHVPNCSVQLINEGPFAQGEHLEITRKK